MYNHARPARGQHLVIEPPPPRSARVTLSRVRERAVMADAEEKREKKSDEKPPSFEDIGVCDELARACRDVMGWKHPSPIQVASVPEALKQRDVIGLAQTGSGKTGAFSLPILQSLLSLIHI